MEKTTNNSEQHQKKMLKTAEDFKPKQYQHALQVYKNLRTGAIIRCAVLYDKLDKNATQCDPSLKGKYKDCFFVVVQGPTYQNDECVSNAIVLKINSNQDKEYQYFFKQEDYPFLHNKQSYLSCRSIGLGPDAFKMLDGMRQQYDNKKIRSLNDTALEMIEKSLLNFAKDEQEELKEIKKELSLIKDDGTKETKQKIEKLKKEAEKFDHCASNAQRNANILKQYVDNLHMRQENKNNNYDNKANFRNHSDRDRSRSRDRERENERHYDNNNNDRRNNDYQQRGRGGYNGGYQQRPSNNYNSFYNQNYRRERGRGGYGNNSGYNYYK